MVDLIQIHHKDELFVHDPFILVLADIHLGACDNFHSYFQEFIKFLNHKIDQGDIKNLKVIIVTGDFLDVMVDDYQGLCENPLHGAIFTEINKILTKGIEIFFILGNHEIPVTGNFTKHKQRFVEEFAEYNPGFNAFKAESIAQYIIYQSLPEGRVKINLFDNKTQLMKDLPFRLVEIDVSNLKLPQKNYIFLHGHQFNPFLNTFGGVVFWNFLLNASGKTKRRIDHTWNKSAEKKTRKIPDEIDWRHKFVKKMINPKTIKTRLIQSKMNLDAVIFGHSHQPLILEEKLNDSKYIYIASSGAWQHVNYPGFIEIGNNNEIRNYQINIIKDEPFF